jgi:hypothetical protein
MSSESKKGGLFNTFVEAAKHELFTEDEPAKTQAEAPRPVSEPVTPSVGAYVPSAAPAMNLTSGAAPVDPAALKVVKNNVYVDIDGHPSRFVKFLKMLDALGRPQDALRALQVADESITTESILTDIGAHLALLDQCNKTATAQFDAASAERLGGRDKEIAALQADNQNAAKEIERHQTETSERNGKIAALQQARSEDEAKITAARQREAGAEAVVRAELQSTQQLFSSKG